MIATKRQETLLLRKPECSVWYKGSSPHYARQLAGRWYFLGYDGRYKTFPDPAKVRQTVVPMRFSSLAGKWVSK